MAIKKNLIENGSPGVWNGSNPHSYTETFSLSGDFSERRYEAIQIMIDKTKLNSNINNMTLYSKFMNYFFDVDHSMFAF